MPRRPWRSRLSRLLRDLAETIDPAPAGLNLDGAPAVWADHVRAASARTRGRGFPPTGTRSRWGRVDSARNSAPAGVSVEVATTFEAHDAEPARPLNSATLTGARAGASGRTRPWWRPSGRGEASTPRRETRAAFQAAAGRPAPDPATLPSSAPGTLPGQPASGTGSAAQSATLSSRHHGRRRERAAGRADREGADNLGRERSGLAGGQRADLARPLGTADVPGRDTPAGQGTSTGETRRRPGPLVRPVAAGRRAELRPPSPAGRRPAEPPRDHGDPTTRATPGRTGDQPSAPRPDPAAGAGSGRMGTQEGAAPLPPIARTPAARPPWDSPRTPARTPRVVLPVPAAEYSQRPAPLPPVAPSEPRAHVPARDLSPEPAPAPPVLTASLWPDLPLRPEPTTAQPPALEPTLQRLTRLMDEQAAT